MLVPESLDDWVTTTEAAKRIGVEVSTISKWVSRGHLEPTGLDERGKPMFRFIEVLRASRDTRQRGIGKRRTA